MNSEVILRQITKIMIPFIFMYGLYIQFHGEYSPGGGFQAGVICAVAFIAYALARSIEDCIKILSECAVYALSGFGVLIYAGVGVVCMLKGGNFLDYSVLASDPVAGQKLGIILIELGVGVTVFAVVMVIFYSFANRSG